MRSGRRRTTLCPGTRLGASRNCLAGMCGLCEPQAGILPGSSTLQEAKARTGRESPAKRRAARRSGCRAPASMREAGGRIGRPGLPLDQVGRAHLQGWAARTIRRYRTLLALTCWRSSTGKQTSMRLPSRSLRFWTCASAPRLVRDCHGTGNCLPEAPLTYAALQHTVSLALLDRLVR
jgi:hypothetical protein